jgi:sarcosine oxidase subunit beta
MTPDGSPFICRTPLAGLYFNGGWCYQGFKATPAAGWCFAHTIANDAEHPLVRHLGLDRFERGNGLDEYALGLWTYRQ